MLEPACKWQPASNAPPVPFALFGVFDGHGGKDAAEECVLKMLPALEAALVRKPSA